MRNIAQYLVRAKFSTKKVSLSRNPLTFTHLTFNIPGKGKVVRQSGSDVCLLVGAGITLHECIKACNELKAEGVNVRVFDPFCLKPLDAQGIIENAHACGGNVITVEDHYPEGSTLF